MKDLVKKVSCALIFLLTLSIAAAAQQKTVRPRADKGSASGTILKGAGKVAGIVVGSAGQAAWVTTKFLSKNVAWPVAKTALVKVPEKAAVYGLKTAGFSLRKGIPMAGKVGFAYLKSKLP
jgi:hypothetical protein